MSAVRVTQCWECRNHSGEHPFPRCDVFHMGIPGEIFYEGQRCRHFAEMDRDFKKLRYRDILISPAPSIVVENDREYWSGDFSIEYHDDSGMTVAKHGTGKIYQSKEDALKDIFAFAKLIVDRHQNNA